MFHAIQSLYSISELTPGKAVILLSDCDLIIRAIRIG